jgi:putative endonuclease
MSDAKRFVYVLESKVTPERHDSGLSSNVSTRLTLHNDGLSMHSSTHRPWRLLVSIEFAEEGTAIAFERYLKSGSGRAFARRHFSAKPADAD